MIQQTYNISEIFLEMDTVSQLLGLGHSVTNAGRLVDALTQVISLNFLHYKSQFLYKPISYIQPSIRVGDSLIRKG